MSGRTLEQRVADLEARESIKELRARYGWHAARGDFASVVELFTPDGVFEFRATSERLRLVGREAILGVLAQVMRPVAVIPLIHNHIIEINGDEAYGSCAMESAVAPGGGAGFVGYYHDRAVRHQGVWLFSERRWFLYRPTFEDSGLGMKGRH